MLEKIREGLYRLEIPLPRNPLRTLNSYIMNSPDRNLIVDTGFNLPECLAALEAGIRELGLDMEKTDVLATHFHADHTGLMPRILTDRSRAFMGRIDRAMLREQIGRGDDYWRDGENRYRREGYPEADLRETARLNPGRHFIADALFEITPLDRGEVFGLSFRSAIKGLVVVLVPGSFGLASLLHAVRVKTKTRHKIKTVFFKILSPLVSLIYNHSFLTCLYYFSN